MNPNRQNTKAQLRWISDLYMQGRRALCEIGLDRLNLIFVIANDTAKLRIPGIVDQIFPKKLFYLPFVLRTDRRGIGDKFIIIAQNSQSLGTLAL